MARNSKYDGYQSMVYNFFDKRIGSGVTVNKRLSENYINQ